MTTRSKTHTWATRRYTNTHATDHQCPESFHFTPGKGAKRRENGDCLSDKKASGCPLPSAPHQVLPVLQRKIPNNQSNHSHHVSRHRNVIHNKISSIAPRPFTIRGVRNESDLKGRVNKQEGWEEPGNIAAT